MTRSRVLIALGIVVLATGFLRGIVGARRSDAQARTTSPTAGHRAQKVSRTGYYLVRGIDSAGHRLFVDDVTNHYLLESDDWGRTFSNKTLPRDVLSIDKILRFKSRLYAIGRSARTLLEGVYTATPTPGPEPLHWSGPTLTIAPPASVLQTGFNADNRYIYVGEYGDPRPGPRVYRSVDGVHWTTVFGPAVDIRHVHGIAGDPYHPGDVWMTLGDGVPAVWRSTDYGAAGTWRNVIKSSAWQSAQISFTPTRIFLAADTRSHTFFVIDRKTLRPRLGTPEYFQTIHPPGSPEGTLYLWDAFFGAVDPRTGIYYCVANDDSGHRLGLGGSWQGLFAVRRIGAPVTVLDAGGEGISMNGEVYFGGGRVWSGQWSIAALH